MADEKKAAFGVFPQMKPRRSKQDREAAKNVPVDLARGVISGALGIPGDIESLARLPYELITGQESPTILPTSEDIEKRLPFKSDTPVGGVATGLGQIAGGFATPAPAIRAAKKLRQTIGNLPPADPRMSQMGVIKSPGGNWLTGSVESATKSLKRDNSITPQKIADTEAHLEKLRPGYDLSNPRDARELQGMEEHMGVLKNELSLNQWIDRNLTNYIKKQMATPDDPVRKLAEEGISHLPADAPMSRYMDDVWANREKAGFPAAQGTSRQAQVWESLSDSAVRSKQLGETIRSNNPGGLTMRDLIASEPGGEWAAKAPDTQFIHELRLPGTSSIERISPELGFDHIIDVLREDLTSGRIRPEQLNKVSMEQAVRRTYEYDQELAAKMAQARASQRADLPVYKEYPEGYRWIELNKPGAFASESEAMGHSVRGYEPPQGHPDWMEGSGDRGSLGYGHGGWEGIKSGKAKVYSLVDPKGNPHVTVEVGANNHLDFNKWWDSQPKELRDEINARARRGEHNWSVFEAPEYLAARDALPPRITQIKGKQNRAPGEEYLPFVQDFVKSGRWSDVGDLGNTGLYRADPEELGMFVPEDPRLRNLPGRRTEDFIKAKEAGLFGDQKYFTRQEWEDILRRQIESESGPLPPLEGMKRGGKVRFTDNPDAMRLELQMAAGGLAKGLKGLAKAAKPAEAPIKASEALGRVEGRPLVITQADRTKVGGGYLGGPGFSGLQLTEPEYRAAEAAWGVKTPGVAKMILGGGKAAGKDPVYAAMLGTPTQHQSNQMVFDKLYGDFKKSAKKGNLDPELRDLINTRLASAVDKKGNPVFPPDVDILSKNFKDLANTFDRRAVTANLIGGVTVGGKKGQIIDYDKIIRETTDPLLIEAPTGAVGNRLFTLSGGIIDRPDLHPAFPTILQGEDLGVSFNPVTRDLIMKDFIQQTMREKGRAPGYMDYTRGYPPSQLITEDLLTELQKLGLKEGGKVKSPAAKIDGNAVSKAAGGEISADDLIIEERPL